MKSSCSVCNRFCKLSGVGEGKGILLSSTVSVGVAVVIDWLPPSEQEDCSGRHRSTRNLNQNFFTILLPFQLFETVANTPLGQNIFWMDRVLLDFLS